MTELQQELKEIRKLVDHKTRLDRQMFQVIVRQWKEEDGISCDCLEDNCTCYG